MNDYQFIEIIFLAAIAGFILYRLYSTLGQDPNRDDNQQKVNRKDSHKSNVIPMHKDQEIPHPVDADPVDPLEKANPVLIPVLKEDPSFNESSFLDGARWAFGTIVEEFARGDISEIKQYISSKVKTTFEKAIKARDKAGEVHRITVIGVKEAEILETKVERRNALVTVKFVSDQDISITDQEGNDLNPDHEQIEEVTDIWTFSRSLSSDDPNWQLTNMHNVETYESSKDHQK